MTASKTALRGREWYESMGSPKYILAPMVQGSEYAWREMSRRYGAQLCYSPMLHARMFVENDKQRLSLWSSMKTAKEDKLIVQFCANDPEILLKAAKQVVPYADGVDINFGCPQGIARKGKYGAFLQDDWKLVYSLINILHKNLEIPVTAKIRVFPSREKTLEYAKMILDAGANILTVHCRTRDQKGQLTGLGDWSILKYLRDNLPPETVLFANGNVLYHEDIHRCLETTGFDGMMVAETNLHNPGIFRPNCYPRVDEIMAEYMQILQELDDESSKHPVKAHMFRLIKPVIMKFIDLRNQLGAIGSKKSTMDDLREIHATLKQRVAAELNGLEQGADEPDFPVDENGYRTIPWYRSQPYFRPLVPVKPGEGKAKQRNEEETRKELQQDQATAAEKSLKRSIDHVEEIARQEGIRT